MNLVPPNLRAFITPSIRRVYLDTPDRPAATPEKDAGRETGAAPSTSVASSSQASEISRLQAENVALRTSCAMWRRRAELHGSANLGLLNFAKMVRDQASNLAREREELQNCCLLLKRRLDEIERFVFWLAIIVIGTDTSGYSVTASKRAAPSRSDSLPSRPLKGLPSRCPSKHPHRASLTSPSAATSSSVLEPSRKRIKTEHDTSPTYLTDGSLGVTGRAMLLPHLPVAHHRPSS